jgi:hypothetical protein
MSLMLLGARALDNERAHINSVSDCGANEEMELICNLNKFSVWSQKSCGNLKLRLLATLA